MTPGGSDHDGRVEIRLHDPGAQGLTAFAALARPLLDIDPVRHTVALSVLDGLCRTGERAAVLVSAHEQGRVAGVALRSTGRPLLVSGLPARYAGAVDEALAVADPELPGAFGPAEEVAAVAAARVARSGDRTDVAMRQRLYALAALIPPRGVAGAPRVAEAADAALLARWRLAFAAEAQGGWHDALTPAQATARAFTLGHRQLLWERAGAPVGFAVAGSPVAGTVRIGPVYTLPEHRGHGYGMAVTAAAAALAAGNRNIVLFADLANPVTNAIYPRLGFVPVHDALDVRFRS